MNALAAILATLPNGLLPTLRTLGANDRLRGLDAADIALHNALTLQDVIDNDDRLDDLSDRQILAIEALRDRLVAHAERLAA